MKFESDGGSCGGGEIGGGGGVRVEFDDGEGCGGEEVYRESLQESDEEHPRAQAEVIVRN